MQQQPLTLSELLEIALPFIAMLVSYAIQQNKFTKQMNAAIAATSIIIVSIITVVVNGQITGNTAADLILVVGTATTLQLHSFSVLDVYLRSNFTLNPTRLLPVSKATSTTTVSTKQPQSD